MRHRKTSIKDVRTVIAGDDSEARVRTYSLTLAAR